MTQQLVVRLASQPHQPLHWLLWSNSEQEIIASGELADASELASLPERTGQRQAIALVPTSDVLLKWVTLPAKAGRKASTVVPFLLEDELNGEISEQFFALGSKQGNQHPVAVIARSKMLDWQAQLADAGLHCNKLLPDILALPQTENRWSILQLGEQLLIRQNNWAGMQGESEWLLQVIAHHARQQTSPLLIDAWLDDLSLSGLSHCEVAQQPAEMPMQVLVKGAQQSTFNLLQGEFKQKNPSTGRWQQWRLVAVLAIVALLVSLFDKGLELNRLSKQRKDLQAQINAEYQRGFPNAGKTRNIRGKVKSILAGLENGGSQVSPLIMLEQLSGAFASSQVKPQSLKFDAKRSELRLQAVASNFDALEEFKRLAESKGFSVQQGAINNQQEQVISSLSIRS